MALSLLRRLRLGVVLAPLIGFGCSSDERRDQNYGTGVAAEYLGPDGGLVDTGVTQSDAGGAETEQAADATTNFDDSPKDTAESADATLDSGPPL